MQPWKYAHLLIALSLTDLLYPIGMGNLGPPRIQDEFQWHIVINLSQRTLSPAETGILSIGELSQPASLHPLVQPRGGEAMELALCKPSKTAADDERMKVHAICHASIQPSRTSSSPRQQLSDSDDSIHVFTADEAKAALVMDCTTYIWKVHDILASDSYRLCSRTPFALHRSDCISKAFYGCLRRSAASCP